MLCRGAARRPGCSRPRRRSPGPARRFGEPLARPLPPRTGRRPSATCAFGDAPMEGRAGGASRDTSDPGPGTQPRPVVVRFRPRPSRCQPVSDEDLAAAAANLPVAAAAPPGLAQPGDLFGLASLRSAIATHLARGARYRRRTRPDHHRQRRAARHRHRREAVHLARVACSPWVAWSLVPLVRVALGRRLLENPCYRPAAAAFQAAGADSAACPWTTAGLLTDDLPDAPASLLYLTPVAPISHRPHAVATPPRAGRIAGRAGPAAMIFEDDHGGDFRYEGGAPLAIAAYAPGSHPAFRHFLQVARRRTCGSAIWSRRPRWWRRCARRNRLLSGGTPGSNRPRWRRLMHERQPCLSRDADARRISRPSRPVCWTLCAAISATWTSAATGGGLHVFWQLPPGRAGRRDGRGSGPARPRRRLFAWRPAACITPAPALLARRGLILGYAALTPKQIEQGIARLSDAVDDALDGHTIGLSDLLAHRPLSSGSGSSASRSSASASGPSRRRHQTGSTDFVSNRLSPSARRHRAASGHGNGTQGQASR